MIFLGYSLVYLFPFLYIIFLHFCTLFVSFLCLSDMYIYVKKHVIHIKPESYKIEFLEELVV